VVKKRQKRRLKGELNISSDERWGEKGKERERNG